LPFAENQFRLTDNFSATPGVRFEHITSSGAGLFAVNNGSNVLMLHQLFVTKHCLALD
jgi:outer membrane receptor protein involved in Fe transport